VRARKSSRQYHCVTRTGDASVWDHVSHHSLSGREGQMRGWSLPTPWSVKLRGAPCIIVKVYFIIGSCQFVWAGGVFGVWSQSAAAAMLLDCVL
jgi:hypothetical protein